MLGDKSGNTTPTGGKSIQNRCSISSCVPAVQQRSEYAHRRAPPRLSGSVGVMRISNKFPVNTGAGRPGGHTLRTTALGQKPPHALTALGSGVPLAHGARIRDLTDRGHFHKPSSAHRQQSRSGDERYNQLLKI